MKQLDSHTVRALLGVRFQLIDIRTNIINQMRAMLKSYGIILKPEFGRSQEEAVNRLCDERHGVLFETLAVLLVATGMSTRLQCSTACSLASSAPVPSAGCSRRFRASAS